MTDINTVIAILGIIGFFALVAVAYREMAKDAAERTWKRDVDQAINIANSKDRN